MNARRTRVVLLCALFTASRAEAQQCAPHAVGGALVSEGRGGFNGRIVASPLGVAVTWAEQHPYSDPSFRRDRPATAFYARVIDRATLAPRGAARVLFDPQAPYELGMGAALVRAQDAISAIVCTCVGGSANTFCSSEALLGAPIGELRPRPRAASVCPQGALAATGVGANVLIGSPFPDIGGVRMYGTAVGALQDVALDGEVDAPAMAAVGADQAVYVRRAGSAIEGRLFDVRGNARGRAVTLSQAGFQVGAPFALTMGDAVVVAFSQRRGRGNWRVHLSTWRPGSAPAHADVDTGATAAMAPSLAPSSNGCVVLSWTEGSGRATVARVGRMCNGALVAGSVAQLSQPSIEAGDSELASDGTSVFALWQEIPPARGARAELRVTRLGCR